MRRTVASARGLVGEAAQSAAYLNIKKNKLKLKAERSFNESQALSGRGGGAWFDLSSEVGEGDEDLSSGDG
jgi:hypothetical protein